MIGNTERTFVSDLTGVNVLSGPTVNLNTNVEFVECMGMALLIVGKAKIEVVTTAMKNETRKDRTEMVMTTVEMTTLRNRKASIPDITSIKCDD